MSKKTHTAGPWTIDETGWCREADFFENQQLIAAAPELLDALKRVTDLLGRYPQHTDAWRECRAAIAKATQG